MNKLGYEVAFYCFASASILIVLLGLIYAGRRQIMPYHLKALETTWDAIDTKYQLMLRMFLNGGGYFGLSTGLFMLIILFIPFREGQLWAGYTIGTIGLVSAFPLALIVYKVKKNTKGDPPLWIMVIINMLLIIGLISCLLSS